MTHRKSRTKLHATGLRPTYCRRSGSRTYMIPVGPVRFQNSAICPDLGFYAARSYSLMRPPRAGRRWIRYWERSATGRSGRGGWSWRLRWGRRPLQLASYRARIVRRCCWPKISIRSVTSVRAVSTNLSAQAFAHGTCMRGPEGASVQQCTGATRQVRGAITQIQPEVADLLHGPRTVRVGGDSEDVHVAAADLHDEQAVQALEGHRAVHVEEIGGEHRRCLRMQERPPGRVGAPFRRRGDLQGPEDPADGGCADPVTA